MNIFQANALPHATSSRHFWPYMKGASSKAWIRYLGGHIPLQ